LVQALDLRIDPHPNPLPGREREYGKIALPERERGYVEHVPQRIS